METFSPGSFGEGKLSRFKSTDGLDSSDIQYMQTLIETIQISVAAIKDGKKAMRDTRRQQQAAEEATTDLVAITKSWGRSYQPTTAILENIDLPTEIRSEILELWVQTEQLIPLHKELADRQSESKHEGDTDIQQSIEGHQTAGPTGVTESEESSQHELHDSQVHESTVSMSAVPAVEQPESLQEGTPQDVEMSESECDKASAPEDEEMSETDNVSEMSFETLDKTYDAAVLKWKESAARVVEMIDALYPTIAPYEEDELFIPSDTDDSDTEQAQRAKSLEEALQDTHNELAERHAAGTLEIEYDDEDMRLSGSETSFDEELEALGFGTSTKKKKRVPKSSGRKKEAEDEVPLNRQQLQKARAQVVKREENRWEISTENVDDLITKIKEEPQDDSTVNKGNAIVGMPRNNDLTSNDDEEDDDDIASDDEETDDDDDIASDNEETDDDDLVEDDEEEQQVNNGEASEEMDEYLKQFINE